MANQFDELAKTLAGGISRRETLRRLGGGLVGAMLASLGWDGKAWSAPAANSQCEKFCRDTCGISPGGGNAFGKCVSSCENCLNANGTVCTCPPPGQTNVNCCASGTACVGEACVNPSTCGTESFNCGEDAKACEGDNCYCFSSVFGFGICGGNETCGTFPACPNGQSDCPPGTFCSVNTCCGQQQCLRICDAGAAAATAAVRSVAAGPTPAGI